MEGGRTLVVGLGGVSNGGKTTTAARLRDRYRDVTVLCQDSYFWPEDDTRHHTYDQYDDYANYDVIESMDMKTLMSDLERWENEAFEGPATRILVVEGILIYDWPDLERKFDLKYFFTLPAEEVRARRKRRTYLPPLPEDYFEKCYWPAYEGSLKYLEAGRDVIVLDGRTDHEENFGTICRGIDDILKSFQVREGGS